VANIVQTKRNETHSVTHPLPKTVPFFTGKENNRQNTGRAIAVSFPGWCGEQEKPYQVFKKLERLCIVENTASLARFFWN
jgi:hypothetical protein